MDKAPENIPFAFGCKQLADIMGVSTFKAREIMHSEGFPLHVYGPRTHRVFRSEFLRWLDGERFEISAEHAR